MARNLVKEKDEPVNDLADPTTPIQVISYEQAILNEVLMIKSLLVEISEKLKINLESKPEPLTN